MWIPITRFRSESPNRRRAGCPPVRIAYSPLRSFRFLAPVLVVLPPTLVTAGVRLS